MHDAEILVHDQVTALLREAAGEQNLEILEEQLLTGPCRLPFEESEAWKGFVADVQRAWRLVDHTILRGLPVSDDGVSCVLAAKAFGTSFKPYRGGRIVKHFRMSPWTTELSQTTMDGHFHTDLNTSPRPPRTTFIQCLKSDPTPEMGQVRVARLADLLVSLEQAGHTRTIEFMQATEVQMVDERSKDAWRGTIIDGDIIRYHPHTLRAANARFGVRPEIDEHMAIVRTHAFEVSRPVSLESGDALVVSNARALHYRGPCTVRFLEFPRKFEGREIFVLHLNDEPT